MKEILEVMFAENRKAYNEKLEALRLEMKTDIQKRENDVRLTIDQSKATQIEQFQATVQCNSISYQNFEEGISRLEKSTQDMQREIDEMSALFSQKKEDIIKLSSSIVEVKHSIELKFQTFKLENKNHEKKLESFEKKLDEDQKAHKALHLKITWGLVGVVGLLIGFILSILKIIP